LFGSSKASTSRAPKFAQSSKDINRDSGRALAH
jgi:hypothetical protein